MEYHGPFFTEEEARKWSKERIKEEIAGLREAIRYDEQIIERLTRERENNTWVEDYQEITAKIIKHEGYIDDYQSAIAFLKSLL